MVDHIDKLPKEGEVIANKYLVNEVLGRGGMGLVVAATHRQLEQRVAIKFLTEEADAEMKQRFNREARAAAKLKSEHVAKVHDVGELDDGTPYMVMEYLQGADLGKVAKRRGQLPIPEAVGYLLQASEAIAEAHAVGIVHRDLKPPNLFLAQNPDGTVTLKVLDFGISKDRTVESLSRTEEDLTKTSMVLGTPHFMAPEQMRSARDVDARADIWSLGAILYQLLTGQRPFRGPTFPELVVAVIQEMPPAPTSLRPDLPVELERAIFKCLAKDPDDRFSNVAELCRVLAAYGPPQSYARADRMERVLGLAPLSSAPSSAPPRSFPAPSARRSSRPAPSGRSWYPDTEQEIGDPTEPNASIGLAQVITGEVSVDLRDSAFASAATVARGAEGPTTGAPPSSTQQPGPPSIPSIGTQMTAAADFTKAVRKGPSIRALGVVAGLSVALLIVVAVVKPSRSVGSAEPVVHGEAAEASALGEVTPADPGERDPNSPAVVEPPTPENALTPTARPQPAVGSGPAQPAPVSSQAPSPSIVPSAPAPPKSAAPAPVPPASPVSVQPPKPPTPPSPAPKAEPPRPPPAPKSNPLDMELK